MWGECVSICGSGGGCEYGGSVMGECVWKE